MGVIVSIYGTDNNTSGDENHENHPWGARLRENHKISLKVQKHGGWYPKPYNSISIMELHGLVPRPSSAREERGRVWNITLGGSVPKVEIPRQVLIGHNTGC